MKNKNPAKKARWLPTDWRSEEFESCNYGFTGSKNIYNSLKMLRFRWKFLSEFMQNWKKLKQRKLYTTEKNVL